MEGGNQILEVAEVDGEITTRVMVDFMQSLENHIQEDGHHQAEAIFH